jgi:hypothetical protein
MNEFVAILIGATACFIVPGATFAMGIWIGRNGMPLEIRWKGKDYDQE